jgi:hypothetical protein
MINDEQLTICKQRGHQAQGIAYGWAECKWCGTWLREVTMIEERQDEPPEAEKSIFNKSKK